MGDSDDEKFQTKQFISFKGDNCMIRSPRNKNMGLYDFNLIGNGVSHKRMR